MLCEHDEHGTGVHSLHVADCSTSRARLPTRPHDVAAVDAVRLDGHAHQIHQLRTQLFVVTVVGLGRHLVPRASLHHTTLKLHCSCKSFWFNGKNKTWRQAQCLRKKKATATGLTNQVKPALSVVFQNCRVARHYCSLLLWRLAQQHDSGRGAVVWCKGGWQM